MAGFNGAQSCTLSHECVSDFRTQKDPLSAKAVSYPTPVLVAAAGKVPVAGNAIFKCSRCFYGDIWGTGSGPSLVECVYCRQTVTTIHHHGRCTRNHAKQSHLCFMMIFRRIPFATTDMLSVAFSQSIPAPLEHGKALSFARICRPVRFTSLQVKLRMETRTKHHITSNDAVPAAFKVNGQWYTVKAHETFLPPKQRN